MIKRLSLLAALGVTTAAATTLLAQADLPGVPKGASAQCNDDAGLNLPPGFCATVYATIQGHARHMAMAPDGTLYVNTWSNRLLQGDPPRDAGFIVALRDTDGDGKADKQERFGTTLAGGSIGGTGIALHQGGLFVEQDDKIVRYALTPGKAVPTGAPEVILSNLQMSGDHSMKPIFIDAKGNLFVNSGSASNVCETVNRQPGAMGKDPCDELPLRAGVWKYNAGKRGQVFSPAERYATGIRNAGGIAFDTAGTMFVVQHGRDQLSQNWPKLYTTEQGVELPAEELQVVAQGDDFGWPYCYFDGAQKKRVLAPEYGGDGGKAIGRCAKTKDPIATFPGHFAPTGLAFYETGSLPNAYRGGSFISFHGSWNRAPAPQDGFRVMFQPMANGRPSGDAILFADGFSGPDKGRGRPANRPTGIIATGDAIYISDDAGGRIWKVVYRGQPNAALAAAKPAPVNAAANPAANQGPIPPGFTAEQVTLGERIYRGIERSGTCAGCHGPDGKGSSVGPTLTGPDWLWADGSVASIAKVTKQGIAQPKKYPSGMPALGGAPLNDSDVQAVAAYVWSLGQKK